MISPKYEPEVVGVNLEQLMRSAEPRSGARIQPRALALGEPPRLGAALKGRKKKRRLPQNSTIRDNAAPGSG